MKLFRPIRNKKGSALLWCVLLIIILTILLGSVLTAAYTYFNYTMRTIKRQQAYFTARSGINLILQQLGDEELRTDEEGNPVLDENGNSIYDIPIMPEGIGEANKVTVTGFDFGDGMGTANGQILLNADNELEIEVTAYYPDELGEKYTMKATAARQPLFFGGVAVKNLKLEGNGDLTLADNTDFYWNADTLFNTSGNGVSESAEGHLIVGTNPLTSQPAKILVNGNLVTKKNATITEGNKFANETFSGTANFINEAGKRRCIWNSSKFIISNKILTVADDVAYETPRFLDQNRLRYHYEYCNHKSTWADHETFFGHKPTVLDPYVQAVDFFANLQKDMTNNFLSMTFEASNAVKVRYIKVLSARTAILNQLEEDKANADFKTSLGEAVFNAYITAVTALTETFDYDVLDISYVDYDVSNLLSRKDAIVPLTYMLMKGGDTFGVTTRVRFGQDPANARTALYQFFDRVDTGADDIIDNWFNLDNAPSYLCVYMEDNTTLELGWNGDNKIDDLCSDTGSPKQFKNSKERVFLYSIYGGKGTTVVLWPNVIVVGEIICDNLIVKGDAEVIYTSPTGSQVGKQIIEEYWSVANYTD